MLFNVKLENKRLSVSEPGLKTTKSPNASCVSMYPNKVRNVDDPVL